jgi:hypothetical protein
MWIKPAEQQAHVVPRQETTRELEDRALAAAEGVGVAMSQDDLHLVSLPR